MTMDNGQDYAKQAAANCSRTLNKDKWMVVTVRQTPEPNGGQRVEMDRVQFNFDQRSFSQVIGMLYRQFRLEINDQAEETKRTDLTVEMVERMAPKRLRIEPDDFGLWEQDDPRLETMPVATPEEIRPLASLFEDAAGSDDDE